MSGEDEIGEGDAMDPPYAKTSVNGAVYACSTLSPTRLHSQEAL
jgi:hypothetical protein